EHRLDAVLIPADLGDRDAAEHAVEEAVRALGGLDLVVSNAAAAVFGHVLEVHPDDFERTVDVTFMGAVRVIRAALPHLRASRGGGDPAPVPGSLWQPARQPRTGGGIPGRDSLLAPLQLGRRMLPSPSTPFRFARHIGTAGARALGLAGTLTAPVPERPAPAR